MKELILKDGRSVLLDDDMFNVVLSHEEVIFWDANILHGVEYVYGKIRGRNNRIYLSTLFPENYSGFSLKFKDNNRLNFQRSNLEWKNRRGTKENLPIKTASHMKISHCPYGGIEIIPTNREGRGIRCIICTRKTPDAYDLCLDLISPTTWRGWKISKSSAFND